MSTSKRGRPKTGLQTCECGYSTERTNNFKQHKTTCKLVKEVNKDELIANLWDQLAAKDEIIREKDKQIFELAKLPRTVTNNSGNTNNTVNNIVDARVNDFGNENIDHITEEQIHKLLKTEPQNAVAKFVKLKHAKAPDGINQNIRIPNKKMPFYQIVVVGEDGEKEWESRTKGEILERIYDDNCCFLECEAIEDDHTPFMDHQDKVKASMAPNARDGGKLYKEELDKIHACLLTT